MQGGRRKKKNRGKKKKERGTGKENGFSQDPKGATTETPEQKKDPKKSAKKRRGERTPKKKGIGQIQRKGPSIAHAERKHRRSDLEIKKAKDQKKGKESRRGGKKTEKATYSMAVPGFGWRE